MTISQGSHLNFTLHLTIQLSEHIVCRFMVLNYETVYQKTLQIQHPSQYFNKSQHRSWHMAKCNMLQHLKWNMNAWDIVIPLYGAILSAILEFVIQFVSNFYNWCPVSLRTIQWKNEVSALINGWIIANYIVSRLPFCPPSWNL